MIEASTAVGIVTKATIFVRAALYTRFYEIATEHRDGAKQVSGKDRKVETKESMVSILFAYTYLEAYINAAAIQHLSSDWPRFRNMGLEQKWISLSNELASRKLGRQHSVFNKGKEPFKSFLELKKIREEYLVHWKAESNQPSMTKYGLADTAMAQFNYEKAEWACKIANDMVTKLNKYMNRPTATT